MKHEPDVSVDPVVRRVKVRRYWLLLANDLDDVST